ncbi:MAG TPA: hypothetical protein VE954_04150, partial [Oligoflexus sp.]|uniref:hypothetical protein n=1 Tax=Oligoflexus sp. TaxID=1971216 RepID=UPI002D2C3E33
TLSPFRYLQGLKTRYAVGLTSPSAAGLSPARYTPLILAHKECLKFQQALAAKAFRFTVVSKFLNNFNS